MGLHCIIHKQSLCEKTFKIEHVMKIVSVVNFIQSYELHFCWKFMLNMGMF
jgi:hypothetical protein